MSPVDHPFRERLQSSMLFKKGNSLQMIMNVLFEITLNLTNASLLTLHSKKEMLTHPVKPCSTELFSFSARIRL